MTQQTLTPYEKFNKIHSWASFQGEDLLSELPSLQALVELYDLCEEADVDLIEDIPPQLPHKWDAFLTVHNLGWQRSEAFKEA